MSVNSHVLGTVHNEEGAHREVTVPGVTLVLGGAAVGTYIGLKIGGPPGAAIGALVGAFVGGFAAGMFGSVTVTWYPDGRVEVRCER